MLWRPGVVSSNSRFQPVLFQQYSANFSVSEHICWSIKREIYVCLLLLLIILNDNNNNNQLTVLIITITLIITNILILVVPSASVAPRDQSTLKALRQRHLAMLFIVLWYVTNDNNNANNNDNCPGSDIYIYIYISLFVLSLSLNYYYNHYIINIVKSTCNYWSAPEEPMHGAAHHRRPARHVPARTYIR